MKPTQQEKALKTIVKIVRQVERRWLKEEKNNTLSVAKYSDLRAIYLAAQTGLEPPVKLK